MKRIVTICALVFAFMAKAEAQIDPSAAEKLGKKLDSYTASISTESIDVQCSEADFLISACNDSLIRQFTAIHLLEHYLDSKFMVAENIAVHIYDEWFASGKVRFQDELQEFGASMEVRLSRNNLIGCKAPEIELRDSVGNEVRLNPKGRLSLLVFYSHDCARCRLELSILKSFFMDNDWPADIYAIYTKDDAEAWKAFRSEMFGMELSRTTFIHLWDPEGNSGMDTEYGVIQTPKMFITDENGIIIGRDLDYKAIETIFRDRLTEHRLEYGTEEAMKLFDSVLTRGTDITATIDFMAESSLERGGRDLFRQMTGDLLYWLSSKREDIYVDAAEHLIGKYILDDTHSIYWADEDDSLKIVGLSEMLMKQFSKAPAGSRIPDIRVYGCRMKGGSEKYGYMRLGRLPHKRTYVIFHTEGCNDCRQEIQEAKKLLSSDKKLRVIAIEMGKAETELSGDEFDAMMGTFDLSSLPHILEIDRKGYITGKYLTLRNSL